MKRELGRIRSLVVAGRLMLLAIFITVLVLAAGLFINSQRQNDLHKDPYVGTAIETSTLKNAVAQLRVSLSANKPPTEATSEYIDLMNTINRSCGRINAYKAASSGKDSAHISRINQTVVLCEDLSKLAAVSDSVFASVKPLLEASTKPRRYQMMFPFANLTRNNHKSAVIQALSEVKKIDFKELDYPFAVQSELQTLQRDIDTSKGLDYLPALNKFQLQILGERQQFWTAYANIEALLHSLTVQSDNYCHNLDSSPTIPACK